MNEFWLGVYVVHGAQSYCQMFYCVFDKSNIFWKRLYVQPGNISGTLDLWSLELVIVVCLSLKT